MNHKAKVAIIGPDTIGTDLMIKVMRKVLVQTFGVVGTLLCFDYFFMRRVRHSTSLKWSWFGFVVC